MKSGLLVSLLLVLSNSSMAQLLPRGLSQEEKYLISEGLFEPAQAIPGEFEGLRSPTSPVRAMAEWEELQAIVITWAGYQSILREIVRHAKEEVVVIIVTTNENGVRTYLENHGIDLSENVEFVNADYNSVWIRDYGGNPVYVRDVDSLAFVDWIYNRPRPLDDVIPYVVAEHLDVSIFATTDAPSDLVNTGGNFMSNGLGRGFSSELVLTENGPFNNYGTSNHDEAAIDAIMQQFMGIDEYVKMPVLPYDGIHHIDMHMKLVDESTLIVGQYPDSIADGPQIEANLQYVIENFKQATGRDYRVVRIPMPPDDTGRYPDNNGDYRTYANAMFVNKTILVPTYEERYDTTALRIWRETMPGYNIVGINCNSIIPAGGALHCIIKEVGVENPIWIAHHQPEFLSGDAPRTLEAQIRNISGIESARLFFRSSGTQVFDSLEMQFSGDDIWIATLPDYHEDMVVEYYFKATTSRGRTLTRPLPAPDGFFRVEIEGLPTSAESLSHHPASITVFPNPAGSLTCVPVYVSRPVAGQLALYDLHGRPVRQIYSGEIPEGESKYFFDAASLMSGYYVLDLRTEEERISRPIVIR